ncbi:XkdQ/YqbQ family protein [Paenibacillus whitsoniae]|uniref:YqbQ/XkdQ domain-containing protein n=1 Tax=Paenibacillus whitsoniae TaxID=2496558 RepID=A0A3S0C674_9BACL|nr:hypothetical protein [Paenibacillus whitsoniae]RTE05486.1 hypothetical protein EJQ19_25010 [Paenibacillus whitsoniae]
MKLIHFDRAGTETDLTNLFLRVAWGGDYREAARKMEVELVASATDRNVESVVIDLASMILLYGDDGSELFRGYVFKKSKSITGNALTLTVYDGLIYLIKSKFSRMYYGVTAEHVASSVCSELGVAVGSLAATGIPQSFPHLEKTGYEAIMTAYTTAGKQNGRIYMPRMQQGNLNVIEKGATIAKRVNLETEHITDSTYTEDIENMINSVQITGENGVRFGTLSNSEWVTTYGLLQTTYRKEEGKDAQTMARALMQDLSRECSVELIGGVDTYDLLAGNAVIIKEAYTGLNGLFFIDADTHTFQNGNHLISLTLNFQNVMDEKEADAFRSSTSSTSGGSFSLTLDNY